MTRNDLVEAIIEQIYEGEDKWLRMKSHIAGSARAKGMSGKRRDAYIYGAMRARGWKPRRERMNETMDVIGRTFKKTGKKIHREFKREIVRPIRSTVRAHKYKVKANREVARGNVGRGLEMSRRADAVIKAHKPVLAVAPIGFTAGFASAVPGGAEMGAVLSAKAVRRITRRKQVA